MAPCGTDHPAWLTSSGTWSPSEPACGQAALTATAPASGRNPASRTSSHDAAAASAQTARGRAASPIISLLPSPRSGLASPRRDWRASHTSEGCGPAAPLEYDPLTGLLPVWPRSGAPASPSLETTVKTSSTSVSSATETRHGAEALPEGGARVPASATTHPRGMEGALTPGLVSSRYDALERPLSSRDLALERPDCSRDNALEQPMSSRFAALEQPVPGQTSGPSDIVRTVPRAASVAVAEGTCGVQNSQRGVSLLGDGTWDGTYVPPSAGARVCGIEGAEAPMLPGSRFHALEPVCSRRVQTLEPEKYPQPSIVDGAEDDVASCNMVIETCVPPSGDDGVCNIEGADAPMLLGSRCSALQPDRSRREALELANYPQPSSEDGAEDDSVSCDTVVKTVVSLDWASCARVKTSLGEASTPLSAMCQLNGTDGADAPQMLSARYKALELGCSRQVMMCRHLENAPWTIHGRATAMDSEDWLPAAAVVATPCPDRAWRGHTPPSESIVASEMPSHLHRIAGHATTGFTSDRWPEDAAPAAEENGTMTLAQQSRDVNQQRPALRIYTGDDLERAPWRTRMANTDFVAYMRARTSERLERMIEDTTTGLRHGMDGADVPSIADAPLRLGGVILGCAALVLPSRDLPRAARRAEERENRIVRSLRLPMPTYDGTEDLGAFEAFVYEWDDWIRPMELSERRAVRLMSHALTGAAKEWYMTHVALDSYPWTIPEIYQELWEVFFSDDFREELRHRLMNAKQNGRRIKDFARELENLAVRFPDVGPATLKRIFWDGADAYIQLFWAEKGRSVEYDDIDTLLIYAQRAERRERVRQRILREIDAEERSERQLDDEDFDRGAIQVSGARVWQEGAETGAEPVSGQARPAEESDDDVEGEYEDYAAEDGEEYESEGDYSGNDDHHSGQEERHPDDDEDPEMDNESGDDGEEDEYEDDAYSDGEYDEESDHEPGADDPQGRYRRRYYAEHEQPRSEEGEDEDRAPQYYSEEEYDGEYYSGEEYDEEPADEEYDSGQPRGSRAGESQEDEYNSNGNDQAYWSEGESEYSEY